MNQFENQAAHEEEERLLREAKKLRLKAQEMRDKRLKERDKAVEFNELRQQEIARAEAKRKRDAEIREFLRPLAVAFERTGWRIKEPYNQLNPVFILRRSNQIPAEEIKIYWKNPGLTSQMGFYWE